jgi:glycosyltransferase involved in cell wall biosynthesis
VITEGVSGFIVENIEESVAAVARLDELDRHAVRRSFEERFSVERMARDYLGVYERLIGAHPGPAVRAVQFESESEPIQA